MTPRRIKAMRKAMGLTQQDMASVLGFSFVSLNRWENGRTAMSPWTEVIFDLLDEALRSNSPNQVTSRIIAATGRPIDVIRILVSFSALRADLSLFIIGS